MDYTRAIFFCKSNHFTEEQTDELILIIKDIQNQVLNDSCEATVKILEKKLHV